MSVRGAGQRRLARAAEGLHYSEVPSGALPSAAPQHQQPGGAAQGPDARTVTVATSAVTVSTRVKVVA